MRAVDTNVIVRLLTKDDPDQFALANRLFAGSSIYISVTVLLETEWVLRGFYGFSSALIAASLRGLAGLGGVTVEDAEAVSQALTLVDEGADFADALHLVRSSGCDDFVTFDRRLVSRTILASTTPVTLLTGTP